MAILTVDDRLRECDGTNVEDEACDTANGLLLTLSSDSLAEPPWVLLARRWPLDDVMAPAWSVVVFSRFKNFVDIVRQRVIRIKTKKWC